MVISTITRGKLNSQLSRLPRKNVEAMVGEAGVSPRALQGFLSTHTWDRQRAIDFIDEASFAERGDHIACVQRQYYGYTGNLQKSTTA